MLFPVLVVGGLLALATVWRIYAAAHERLDRSLRVRAELVADMIVYANEAISRPEELQRVVLAIGGEQEVSLIVVVGGSPVRVVASTRPAWVGAPMSELPRKDVAEDLEEALETGLGHHHFQPDSQAFDFTTPLLVHGRPSGAAVMVHLDIRPTQAAIHQSALELSLFALAGITILAVLGFVLLDRVVLRPVATVARAVELHRGGDGAEWKRAEGDDEIGALASTLRDALERTDAAMSELDRQRASLAASEERLQRILRGSTDAAWDVDLASKELFLSPRWWEMSGYAEGEIEVDSVLDNRITHPDDRARVRRVVAEAVESGAAGYEVELRLVHASGRHVPILARGSIARDADGRPVRISGTNTDLTSRRQIEAELRAQEVARAGQRQLCSILDTMSAFAALFTVGGDVVEVNRAIVDDMGVDRGDVVGKPFWTAAFFAHSPHSQRLAREAIERAASGTAVRCDLSLRARTGVVVTSDTTFSPLRGESGLVEHVVVSGVDISERIRSEEQMRDSLHEKETLLREVHHRVKNNLQIVASLLHFQAKKDQTPAAVEIFREAQDRLRAMTLVHEQLYRSDDLHRVSLGDFVAALCRQLQQSFSETSGRVVLRLETQEVLCSPDVALPCGMIVTELVTNAFKYAYPSPRGGAVVVRVLRTPGSLVLSVSDEGVGLAPPLDPARATTFGFRLVESLSEQLGAVVCRIAGKGTTVRVEVPLGEDAARISAVHRRAAVFDSSTPEARGRE